jgi:FAD-dependent oxidoreductase domain-containing protein 1
MRVMARIIIIGGGVMGSSAAYHLAMAGAAADVTVIEPDPTYEFAATPRSSGGVRSLHSLPENIHLALYSQQVYGDFDTLMAVDGEVPHLGFRRHGYLNIANKPESAAILESAWKIQTREGARVDLLDAAGVKARFPSLHTGDVISAANAIDDGSLDPYAALTGFRKKAISLGVAYRKDRVVGIEHSGGLARGVILASGEKLAADFVVNLTGAWASEVCAMVGMKIPVEPMRRMTFYYECREDIEVLPTTRDDSGVSVRPEGKGFISGYTDKNEPGGWNWEMVPDFFERVIWGPLAHRVPKFEAIKLGRSWPGHYAMNRLDGNVIIGPWEGEMENFITATGFSGAGLQKAPAIGRAIKELVLDGGYRTIDLTRFSYRRVQENRPLREAGLTA